MTKTTKYKKKLPVTLESLGNQITNLATSTKADIQSLRSETKADIEALATMTKQGFDEVGQRLDNLEHGQEKLEKRQANLEEGQTKLEKGQEEIKYRLSERAMEYDVRDLDRRVKILEEAR